MVLRCPRDRFQASLEEWRGAKGRFVLDGCMLCGGVWFDRGEITKLTGDREIERLIVKYASGSSGLRCPRCDREMAVRPVAEVTLDVCPNCKGVWFDAGELEVAPRRLAGEITIFEPEATPPYGLARAEALVTAAFASPRSLKTLLKPPKRRFPPEKL